MYLALTVQHQSDDNFSSHTTLSGKACSHLGAVDLTQLMRLFRQPSSLNHAKFGVTSDPSSILPDNQLSRILRSELSAGHGRPVRPLITPRWKFCECKLWHFLEQWNGIPSCINWYCRRFFIYFRRNGYPSHHILISLLHAVFILIWNNLKFFHSLYVRMVTYVRLKESGQRILPYSRQLVPIIADILFFLHELLNNRF